MQAFADTVVAEYFEEEERAVQDQLEVLRQEYYSQHFVVDHWDLCLPAVAENSFELVMLVAFVLFVEGLKPVVAVVQIGNLVFELCMAD
jgi:hypothetical protein